MSEVQGLMSETNEKPEVPKKSIEQVARETGRYDVQAYYFLFETLEWLMGRLDERRHVSGAELSQAVRDLAVERFGMLAGGVMRSWGVNSTSDFGRMVYDLIEAGQMSRTEEDDIHDFDAVFDFEKAFATYEIPGQPKDEGKN